MAWEWYDGTLNGFNGVLKPPTSNCIITASTVGNATSNASIDASNTTAYSAGYLNGGCTGDFLYPPYVNKTVNGIAYEYGANNNGARYNITVGGQSQGINAGYWQGTQTFMCLAINHAEQKAVFALFVHNNNVRKWLTYGATNNIKPLLYQAIMGIVPPTYTWQSVPSISGKNGILVAMSTISDMNDGEPVTTTDTTKFTLVEESNVGVITEDIDDSIRPGADAGGISGSGSNSGTQSTGYAFGQGESGTNKSGGGGSGLYGGYKGTSSKSGGAGSGYIGNSLVSNKKMVGYNVPTSSAEGTKTESVNETSASAVANKPKSGNGFARIKFLREVAQFRSIGLPLANRIVPAKFKPEYSYYYGREEVPTGEQYYDIEGATAITIQRGGGDSFTFGDLPACFGIYDPNSSNVVNWYLRKVNSSGASMLVNGANTGSFSPDGNYTFYVIAGGEPENPNGKGYFTVIRTTDWSNGWGGLAFSTDVMVQLRNYFTWE